ncbi:MULTISPECIES: AraC family transcriptional regulator [Streptomyces]|uniref:Transcription activator effector binding protein n=1 Tax=Streptomyces pratensis (strain ATCC 33331 / IAF-45CD) TaxID=591167 RepID=A0A8D4BCN4_STRFA|nr:MULTISPECIES: AraC family transcriptional regulator [Streptomyces]MDF9872187.1 AraC family transcriptional regulator [Streptomyces pratensis]AGJ55176.1 transcriptional regulator [Streptomyces sp. PAMC 26508]MDX2621881.1 AraC family transcriptional regulator [Streptomyces sp. WI03-5b]MDX3182502.1 AraC family transcriptional regulator [Streptomyces sp. ME02-7008A-1]MDX3302955.1 AraC family transcriptional regulator [Streptomyces sp. ME02-7008A]
MLERLNQAMEHIESHLDQPLDVAGLARIATTSEYHFRRMFSALAGLPLSEYVRRRRLTVAGAEVLAGERTLLDIATRYGYGSGEAFARAFRAVHGVGPGEARRTGAALRSQQRMSFRLIVEGTSSMRYRIVDKADFRVVGRKARVPLVHEGANPAIADFIRGIGPDVMRRVAALGDQEPAGIVGVSDQLDPSRAEGTELDYYHGVVTGAEVPEDMDALDVPAGRWAVFEHSGPFPQSLQYLWRDVFTQWFPSNPYVSRPGPEILSVRLSEEGTQADAELWIPVERSTA